MSNFEQYSGTGLQHADSVTAIEWFTGIMLKEGLFVTVFVLLHEEFEDAKVAQKSSSPHTHTEKGLKMCSFNH